MNDLRMDPGLADALREELRREVRESAVRRPTRSRRPLLVIVGVAALVLLVGAALIAGGQGDRRGEHVTDDTTASPTIAPTPSRGQAGVLPRPEPPLPGGIEVTWLSEVVSAEGTGVRTIDLGPPPTGTTDVDFALTCLGAGTFTLPDGSGIGCDAEDAGQSASGSFPVDATTTSYRISAGPQATWAVEAVYTRHEITDWAVNARGETYGVENERGSPELVGVVATNGREGYARRTDLDGPEPRTPEEALEYQRTRAPQRSIPVFASDGVTRIGTFVIGG
ncbi:hypothetical protein [Nocardioides humi]|uniref:Uncharacterized protein n=1 Tax=Nocardioides humi TaxID=449461 RepID=A0ABN2ANM2_9ACTN|nr:hypothetical protein [Nocardioides humi]